MIYGKNRYAHLIVAKNIPGYNEFVNEDFTLDFFPGEKIKIQYPPDHPNQGLYYKQASAQLDGDETTFGVVLTETRRISYRREDNLTKYNKDFFLPYQTELTVVVLPSFKSGIRPVSDRNIDADEGKDAFILHGSIIEGVDSKAKRFYSGPYKGFTKEIEGVCDESNEVNLMDGGDCDGWKKGSFYEFGYDPRRHNIFNYAGEPPIKVNHKNSFNENFMKETPYQSKNYQFINTRNRLRRPVPYDILAVNDKGHSAILLSNKHVLVSKYSDINNDDLVFYSPSEGIVSATVHSSVITFKEIWDFIGFASETRDSITNEAFNNISLNFAPYKIITLANELPSDVQGASLLDIDTSNPIFHGMVISHEARGHIGIFCKPIDKETYDENAGIDMSFKNVEKCGGNYKLTGSTKEDMTLIPVVADTGSPVVTYYRDKIIFLGFCTGIGYSEKRVKNSGDLSSSDFDSYVRIHGCSLGSTKKYTMGWGSSYSSFDILNMYLEKKGDIAKAKTISVTRFQDETSITYPYPDISFKHSLGETVFEENEITDFIDFR